MGHYVKTPGSLCLDPLPDGPWGAHTRPMRERAAFLAGYLMAAEHKNRTLARELVAIDPLGRDLETWRGYLKRWLRLQNEPADEATMLLARALGVGADAFPKTLPQDVDRRLERLEEAIAESAESLRASVDSLADRVRRLERLLAHEGRQGQAEGDQ